MEKETTQQAEARLPSHLPELECNGYFLGAGGKLYAPGTPITEVEPVLPDNGKSVVDKVVLVNGIVTDTALHLADMQSLANTGAEVIGIHNSTSGRIGDILEYFGDKFKLTTSKPVETISSLLRPAVYEGKPLHLVGHSQGALMIARALELVREEALRALGTGKEDVAARMAHIKVETYGGGSFSYSDGPQYVHVDNLLDPVSQFLGVGALGGLFWWATAPGKDAKVYRFTEINTDLKASGAPSIVDKLVHGPQAIYFKHRVSFEEARAGNFRARPHPA